MNHVVVGIISRQNDRNETEHFLVSSRRDFGEFSGSYYPPGGHMEAGEDEPTALIREIFEETQLKIRPDKKIAETGADVPNQTTHWWTCTIIGGKMNIDEQELADAGWFTKQQMETMKLWPTVKKVFAEKM